MVKANSKKNGPEVWPEVGEMLPSNYLRQEDVGDEPIEVTIASLTLDTMPSGDSKWVLHLKELDKGLVLNTINTRALEKAWGSHTKNWQGRRAEIWRDTTVTYQGQTKGGLRIRPLPAKKQSKKPPQIQLPLQGPPDEGEPPA